MVPDSVFQVTREHPKELRPGRAQLLGDLQHPPQRGFQGCAATTGQSLLRQFERRPTVLGRKLAEPGQALLELVLPDREPRAALARGGETLGEFPTTAQAEPQRFPGPRTCRVPSGLQSPLQALPSGVLAVAPCQTPTSACARVALFLGPPSTAGVYRVLALSRSLTPTPASTEGLAAPTTRLTVVDVSIREPLAAATGAPLARLAGANRDITLRQAPEHLFGRFDPVAKHERRRLAHRRTPAPRAGRQAPVLCDCLEITRRPASKVRLVVDATFRRESCLQLPPHGAGNSTETLLRLPGSGNSPTCFETRCALSGTQATFQNQSRLVEPATPDRNPEPGRTDGQPVTRRHFGQPGAQLALVLPMAPGGGDVAAVAAQEVTPDGQVETAPAQLGLVLLQQAAQAREWVWCPRRAFRR